MPQSPCPKCHAGGKSGIRELVCHGILTAGTVAAFRFAGLRHTVRPMISGIIELAMRVAIAGVVACTGYANVKPAKIKKEIAY